MHEVIEWNELADHFPTGLLAGYNRRFGNIDPDAARQYLDAARFQAPWDSLGRERFAALPGTEQAWRRTEAAAQVRQAFLAVADRGYRLRQDQMAGARSVGPLVLLDRVLARALGSLHTAVGTDPTSAAAWSHLAYFSHIAGDRRAATRARHEFLAVTDAGDPHRARHLLDEAWDLRDAGRLEPARLWLDGHAAELRHTRGNAGNLAPAVALALLRGLLAAEQGDVVGVRRAIADLPLVDVRDGARTRPSEFLRAWVNAWSAMRTGDLDLAAFHLGVRRSFHLPAGIGWRYWQDVGLISEALDQPATAREYWTLAYHGRPYHGFMPQVALRGPANVLGRGATGQPYVLGFRRHFLVGSMWSYAATRALACQLLEPGAAPWLWDEAFASLDACVARGFREADARLLRARLNLQRGDVEAALDDLTASAVSRLSGRADRAEIAFLDGVAHLNRGDLEGSLPLLENAVALEPSHLRSWQALAIARSYLGHADAALAAFDRAFALAPDDGVNAFNRALLHLQHGRHDAAEADLLRAAQLLPDNARALKLLQALATGREITIDSSPQAVSLVASSDELDLARSLDRLVAGEANSPQMATLLAGDPAERELWLELFARRFTDEPTAANRRQLAEARAQIGDAAGVVAVLAPAWPELSEAEAILLLDADRQLGHVVRAGDLADGATGPRTVPVLVRAATILLDHGRRAAAAAVIADLRTRAPDDPALDQLLARLGSG